MEEIFYTDEHFAYALELALLKSDDPGERREGVAQLSVHADAGDTRAMLLLAAHYRQSADQDLDKTFRWYLKAAQLGSWEARAALVRLYAHPDDAEMAACLDRLRAEGYTDAFIFKNYNP